MRRQKETDFIESMLPRTRRQLFLDIYRHQIRVLLGLGLVLLSFALPFLLLRGFRDFYVANLYSQKTSDAISSEAYESSFSLARSLFLAIMPLTFALIGLSLGAIARIMKRLTYLDPIFFGDDFKKGMKQNGSRIALSSFIGAAFFSAAYFLRTIDPANLGLSLPLGLFFLLFFPVLLWLMPVTATYQMKWKDAILFSAKLYIRTFFPSLMFTIIFLLPLALEFIPIFALKYALAVLYLIVIWPGSLLGFFLLANHYFDRFINKERYPSIYRKGLYVESKKDDLRL